MSVVKKAILSIVGNKLLSPAEVVHAELVGRDFRKIVLAANSLKNCVWRPGEKIQINVGDWNVRTYTPLSLDPKKGHLQVIAYLHGQGPGSAWAKSVQTGQLCQFIGPRPSIELEPQPSSILIFGDETSLPMAVTFRKQRGSTLSTECLFEVSSPESCEPIVENLNLPKTTLFKKTGPNVPSDLLQIFREKVSKQNFDNIILTGNAKSIQLLRSELKILGFSLSQVKVKAYWALGKSGID